MPVTYSIDPVQRLVLNLATGVLTDDDLRNTQKRMKRNTQKRMKADPEFRPEYSQLFDLTLVTDVRISSAYLQEMASATAFAPGARRALVVSQTLLYGLSRQFQGLLGDKGEEFRVFHTRPEAEWWIDPRRIE